VEGTTWKTNRVNWKEWLLRMNEWLFWEQGQSKGTTTKQPGDQYQWLTKQEIV